MIEQKIRQGKLESLLLDFWRGLIQTHPWVIMAFAGLHILQEVAQDYWNSLFGSAIGQPYLVQLICHCLASYFNRQTIEEEIERERRFHRADVEAVIATPEFFKGGKAYFTGVWQQARRANAQTEHGILNVLAQVEVGLSIEDIVKQSGLALEQAQQALNFITAGSGDSNSGKLEIYRRTHVVPGSSQQAVMQSSKSIFSDRQFNSSTAFRKKVHISQSLAARQQRIGGGCRAPSVDFFYPLLFYCTTCSYFRNAGVVT